MKSTTLLKSMAWLAPLVLAGCFSSPEYADGGNDGDNNIDQGQSQNTITGIEDTYDAATVQLGEEIYAAQCESCHGDETKAGPYGAMFLESTNLKSATQYVNYIRDFMPISQAQACGQACSEAVFAYGVEAYLRKDMNDSGNDNSNGSGSDGNGDTGGSTGDGSDGGDNTGGSTGGDNTGGSNGGDMNGDQMAGQTLYGEQCASCHGEKGEGGFFPAFFKPGSSLQNDADMISYIVETMPYGDVEACGNDCATKILAYAKVEFEGSYDKDDSGSNGGDTGNTGGGNTGGSNDTTPVAPSNSIAMANGSQDLINVFWVDNSNNEDGFEVQRRVNQGAWSSVALTESNSTIFVDMEIQVAGEYEYRVRAKKGALASSFDNSNVVTIAEKEAVITKPAAPTNLSAVVVEAIVTLTWKDNASNEQGFKIERREQGGTWSQVNMAAANVTSYANNTVMAGKTYEYRVKAYNQAGDSAYVTVGNVQVKAQETNTACDSVAKWVNGTSYNSGQKVFNRNAVYECKVAGWCSSNSALHYEPGAGLNWQDAWKLTAESCSEGGNNVVVPASVSSVQAQVNAGNSAISVSWVDASDNELGFKLERKVNTGSWVSVSELQANVNTYTDTDITIGNAYQYRVKAFNSAGESKTVSAQTVTVEAEETVPSAASNVTATLVNDGQVRINFNDRSDNEVGFKLERKVNTGSWSVLVTLAANATSYADNSVQAGNAYQYRVAPFNSAGTATYVQTAQVTIEQSKSENQVAFDSACSGCHTPTGGIGGNLFDGFAKNKWQAEDYFTFFNKVKTMPTQGCDDDCKDKAATYVWTEAWGLAKEVVVVANGRGVRGIRLLAPFEYQNAVKDLTGVTIDDANLPKQYFDTSFKYPTQGDKGIVLYEGMQKYLALAEDVSTRANLSLLGCSSSACSSSQVASAGLKMFRRPLTSTELSTYQSLNSSHGSREMLAGMLMSPYFLYKMELGTWNAGENAYELNDYEVASTLAFMLWGTTPDATLLSKAQAGQLGNASQITSVAQTMMNDARFKKNMSTFVKYYTHAYAVATEKPGLTSGVINAMYQEQASFIAEWLGTDASFNKLFNPGYTYVNSTLANHYGMNASGSAMQKVSTGETRGGLLHQGLTQIMNSDHQATSLVKRGKMVRENLMCHTMGVPSGVDPSTIDMPNHAITTRERWDIITGPTASNGQCWECHQLMNEPGSSLERFDQTGRYRTTEKDYNGSSTQLVIETAGTLRSNTADPLTQYEDARELAQYLGSSDIARECFTQSIVQFGLGHKEDAYMAEELSGIKANFNQNDDVKELIKAIVGSSMFRMRVNR